MKLITCFISMLLLSQLGQIRAAETTNSSIRLPSSLEDAEAWNVTIKRVFEFPAAVNGVAIKYGIPAFSRDFRSILYVVGEPFRDPNAFNPYNPTAFHTFLIVQSLENKMVLKKILLDGSFSIMAGSATAAYSPKENKVVIGPLALADKKDGLLFVDIETSKITPVPIDFRGGSHQMRITWPGESYLGLTPKTGLNLDTLKIFDISPEQYNTSIKALEFHHSKQQKFSISLITSRKPGYPKGVTQPYDLVIAGRNYSKLIFPEFATDNEARNILNGSRTVISTLESWAIWSPDFRYILFSTYPGKHSDSLILIELGLRATPDLTFTLGRLFESLTDTQRQQIKRAFSAGKPIWANVYGRKINPLNDRLLGPDKDHWIGDGGLVQIEPTVAFQLYHERLSAEIGNVASDFQVENDWSWDNEVWGEIIAATNIVKASTTTSNLVQQAVEGTRQQADQTAIVGGENLSENPKEVFEKVVASMDYNDLFATQVLRCRRGLKEVHEGLVNGLSNWNIRRNETPRAGIVLISAEHEGADIRQEIVLVVSHSSDAECVIYFKLFEVASEAERGQLRAARQFKKPYLPQYYTGAMARKVAKHNFDFLRQITKALEYSALH